MPDKRVFHSILFTSFASFLQKQTPTKVGAIYRWISKSTITESILPINRQINHIYRLDSTLYYMKKTIKISITKTWKLNSYYLISDIKSVCTPLCKTFITIHSVSNIFSSKSSLFKT